MLDRQPRRLIIDAISPRTPDRGNVAPTASGSNHYSHVAGSPRGGYLYSPSLGAGLYQHLLTPQARQVGRPPKQSPAGSSKNPPTPLDSLVDVALNMTEDSPPSRRRRRARRRRDGAHLARGCVVRWTCVRTKLRRMRKNQRSKLEGVNHEHDWGRLLHRRLSLLRRECLREVRKKKRVRFLDDRVLLHHHQTLMWMRMGTLILILIRNLVRHRRAFLV